jgi:hypothetical protein
VIEQCVSAGEQETVKVTSLHETDDRLILRRADSHRANHPLPAEFVESYVSAFHHRIEVVRGIVEMENVNAVQAEPLKASLQGTHDPVIAKVERRMKSARIFVGEKQLLSSGSHLRKEGITYFAGENKGIAVNAFESTPES